MLDIPVIETARLRLRGPALRDFGSQAELWAHPEVVRFTTGEPQTPEQTWSRLLRCIGHWTALDFGAWMLEDKLTAEFIGEAGFADLHRDLQSRFDGIPETGWILHPSRHGKGFATEAVQAILSWGRERWGAIPVACLIRPEHKASLRVAENPASRSASKQPTRTTRYLSCTEFFNPCGHTQVTRIDFGYNAVCRALSEASVSSVPASGPPCAFVGGTLARSGQRHGRVDARHPPSRSDPFFPSLVLIMRDVFICSATMSAVQTAFCLFSVPCMLPGPAWCRTNPLG